MELKEIERSGTEELSGKTDHTLSMVAEEGKNGVLQGTEAVSHALLNEDDPLKGEDVEELWTAANALCRLCEELARRVPEEHRTEGQPGD